MKWITMNWLGIASVVTVLAASVRTFVALSKYRRERRREKEREFRRQFMVAGPDPECNAMWARILDAER